MKEFECPKCGSGNLYQRRKETVATRLYPTDTDFDLGKEEVVDCDTSRLECCNDHPLVLKCGKYCDTHEDYLEWLEEQK